MPSKGRPRLGLADLEARIADYCRRYHAVRAPSGLPSFPTGKRETPQHREWMALYKARNRLGRRSRGQCERCSRPATDGSIFCEDHRPSSPGRTGLSLDERRRLLSNQGGRCPVCDAGLELSDCVEYGLHSESGHEAAVLHPECHRLATLAVPVGPEGLSRLARFLWPRSARRTTRPRLR
jgi:hypothetical protein